MYPSDIITMRELQCMPQSLNECLLRLYALDERVWAGITRKLITARNALDASRSVKIRSGIVAYTVSAVYAL